MIVGRELKHKGYYQLDELSVKMGDKIVSRELLTTKNGVGSLVFNKVTQKYIFVSQWRPCLNDNLLEIVGGSIDEVGGDPIEAIKKEVEEEIGYECDSIEFIDECYVSPGTITEFVKIYYIEVSNKINDGGGSDEEDEVLDVIEMTYDEIVNYKFKDAKTIISINWIKNKK
jgi:ADP-ribose pyrophosphatase